MAAPMRLKDIKKRKNESLVIAAERRQCRYVTDTVLKKEKNNLIFFNNYFDSKIFCLKISVFFSRKINFLIILLI